MSGSSRTSMCPIEDLGMKIDDMDNPLSWLLTARASGLGYLPYRQISTCLQRESCPNGGEKERLDTAYY
jgi:hypothetical protein